MKPSAPSEISRLRGPILRSVSRSFFLSLRILPADLRDPISLAYLLARATDTIADTRGPSVELRLQFLENLAATIQGALPPEAGTEMRRSFASLQKDEAERDLIESLPAAVQWLDSLDNRDQLEVRAVLKKINRGQRLDLERFGESNEIRALTTASELEEYTYLVAGCVGEFWTRVCFAHVENFSEKPESEMCELGVEYGKGLQLVNILRDAGSDLRQGRCYLPGEELHSLGLTPAEILNAPERAGMIVQKWREKAEQALAGGIDYACAIRNRRLRFATALPALIGARTLALLRTRGAEAFQMRVKVMRSEVRKIVLSAALNFVSPGSLRASFSSLLRSN